MLSLETEARLARLLTAIAEGEKRIEIVRQVLAEQPMFEPYAAFQRISKDVKSLLEASHLHHFLKYVVNMLLFI
jgi:hypothetical protein